MTRHVADARLDVHYPGNEDANPDHTVPSDDIASISINERLQEDTDAGQISLHDNNQAHRGNITSGDMVRVWIRLSGQSHAAWGTFSWGEESWGQGLYLRWTAVVRTPTPRETGPSTQMLDINVQDFVFGVLSFRNVTNAFKSEPISGSSNAILETILTNNASEIDRGGIEDVNATADVNLRAKSLLECVRELGDKGDALLAHKDDRLIFKQLSTPSSQWTLQGDDRGLATASTDDQNLVNQLRVEGGEDTNIDDKQTTQTATKTVTDSTRIIQQLSMSKSTVALVEVYTKTTGSGDNVVIRIHPDDGNGSPVDVGNQEQDLAKKAIPSDFLDDDGYTTFLIPEHDAFQKDPHLLIESDGSSGQDIGVDGSDNPTYKAHYPYRLATVVDNQSSIGTYRRREDFKRAPEAQTKPLTEQRGRSVLRHASEPADEIEFDAESDRAHQLRNGDVITIDEPHLDVGPGDFILTERNDRYDGGSNQLTTNLRFQDVTTV